MSRGQGAVEFTLITIAMLFLFATSIIVAEQRFAAISEQRFEQSLEATLTDLEQEFFYAQQAGQGYVRNFTLPMTFYGRPYEIHLRGNQTSDGADELSLVYEGIERVRFLDERVHGRIATGPHTISVDDEVRIGPVRRYLHFNGTTDGASTTPPAMIGTPDWAVSFWMRPELPATRSQIFKAGTLADDQGLWFWLNATHGHFGWISTAAGPTTNVVDIAAHDEEWLQVTTTYNGTSRTLRTYIDGTLADEDIDAAATPMIGAGNMRLGMLGGGYAAYDYVGGLSDLYVFDRALNPLEAAELFSGAAPQDPLMHWPLEDTGTTAEDAMGIRDFTLADPEWREDSIP